MLDCRSLLTCIVIMTLCAVNAHAAGPVATVQSQCDALLSASEAATAYASVANANLAQASVRPPDAARWSKFDTKRMLAALAKEQSGETLHYVLYSAGKDLKLTPVSLMLLWSLHTKIVYVNAESDTKSAVNLSELRERVVGILVDSRVLAEIFAHAARICQGGLGPHILRILGMGVPPSLEIASIEAAQAELLPLIRTHKKNVESIFAELRAAFPESEAVREREKSLPTALVPVWTVAKAEAGARVINDVWLPAQYAEPLMKSIIEEQVKAIDKGR